MEAHYLLLRNIVPRLMAVTVPLGPHVGRHQARSNYAARPSLLRFCLSNWTTADQNTVCQCSKESTTTETNLDDFVQSLCPHKAALRHEPSMVGSRQYTSVTGFWELYALSCCDLQTANSSCLES